ncbi:MAG TPA: DUF5916 domain-containing protein [Bacteroidales bacterium]|nr:DUF5916 domain-containing protein [Bacteroidales bacterium]HPR11120.1 DUF5916 domain-containing protein [Bacteroidales bacterium]HRW84780.1 DUF5916 domain-containing protein [Bacteroidales bacterium]
MVKYLSETDRLRSYLFIKLIIFFLFTGSGIVHSQIPGIKAVFTGTPPVIDGFTDDEVWKNAAVVDDFYQKEPRNGEAITEKTEFLFLFDRHNIYVGIRCYDDPAGIIAKELARDVSLGEDDRIQVIFDTFLDGRSGYWFQIGPRGSIGDALINENGQYFNKAWDGIWDGKAKITGSGWEAELIIPFKTMGFDMSKDTWGLKCIRHIKRKSEFSTWPASSLDADKFQVSDCGRISGLKDMTQGIGLDVIPYATGGFSKKENDESRPVADIGVDAFYQITPSLKAAVTVNTDFAQTEVDEKQINLTRFSLFFPEKRDFFLDGSNYFNFGINGDDDNTKKTSMIPFFSRSIGLDSTGNPVAIKYGGKFTGKAGRFNFGVLHIKDDNAWDNPGYTVGRVSVDLGKQSSVGIIGSNGNAFSDADNSLAGFDLRIGSSELKGNKNLKFSLYGVKSFTEGLSGHDLSFGTEINYPNDFLNFRAGYLEIGENFTPGLGFVPRKGIRDIYGGISLGPRPKNSPILQIKTGTDYSFIFSTIDNDLLTGEINLNYSTITFLSGDIIALQSQYQFDRLRKPFNIFDTINIPAGDYNFWRHTLTLTSAKRRNLWGLVKTAFGSFYSGHRTDLLIQTGYKICVPVYLGLDAERRWVTLAEGDFVTQIFRINLNFLFSPNIYWSNFAQYDNKTETIGWQSRFQWIIKPGKEVFLTFNSPLIDPHQRFTPEVYEARLKVKYTIRF